MSLAHGHHCPCHNVWLLLSHNNNVCCTGKAVFASCPHELTCTENETLALPANGRSVSFNATVIHIGGGSCGYQQNIPIVKLIKINETTGERSKILYVCNNETGSCRPIGGSNVNLTKGRSGFEFIFILSNVMADDIGTYVVIMEKQDPQTGASVRKLNKAFHLVGK